MARDKRLVPTSKMVARPRTRCQHAELGHRGKLRSRWQPRFYSCRGKGKCAGAERGRQADRCRGVGGERRESPTDGGVAIAEACAALQRVSPSTAISRDSHYQLSNRVAFAWKLANAGVPTVLVYLGFWGDDGLADVGAPFQSAAHWEADFTEHARSVVPMDLFEYRVECGAAPMWLLVRSRKVMAASVNGRGHECATAV